MLQELQRIGREILNVGRADSNHIEDLGRAIHAGPVDRPSADYLVEMHKRLTHPNPAFERIIQKGIKAHVLADGTIDADEVKWLRGVIFRDGAVSDEERKLLHELKGEATSVGPEFEALFTEAMKMPVERHTSGGGRGT